MSTLAANTATPRPACPSASLQHAISRWQEALGEANVQIGPDAQRRYRPNTLGLSRCIGAALVPSNLTQIVQIVRIAGACRIPLYPISRGRNWGYGAANPVTDHCVIVDCSQMTRIHAFDADLGLVTVEPGVSQAQLHAFLADQQAPYLVPVTGAGPDASILGNAVERGYGITPYGDHFGAVTAFEAVLPNGKIYRSALTEMGGKLADQAFKWGIGPYLDGLFTQANMGIVTAATIALAPRPDRVAGFFFDVPEHEDLGPLVQAVRQIMRNAGGTIGAVNLMNTHRVLAMIEPYPGDQADDEGRLGPEVVKRLAARNRIGSWMGVGAIYGDRRIVRSVTTIIRQRLRRHVRMIRFITPQGARRLRAFCGWAPRLVGARFRQRVDAVYAAMTNFAGAPSQVALPLAYWKSGRRPPAGQAMDPARDACGLIWFSPLVPMKPGLVGAFVDCVTRTCLRHAIEPLITLTTVSDRCFDSTVPILFDPSDPGQVTRAHYCYDDLFARCRKLGCLPYRAGVHSMHHVVDPDTCYWQLVSQIKQAVDPAGIIAPGRYCPVGVEE